VSISLHQRNLPRSHRSQFLEEKLTLEQIEFQALDGVFQLKDLVLGAQVGGD
jgi:hypothetical protein